jgi:ferredoxin
MLTDLCAYHVGSKPTFNLLDGILAMEGNGPTGGNPKKLGCLISGRNPFSVDMIGSHIIGFDGIIMLDEAKRRGFTADAGEINLISDAPLANFISGDFIAPESVDKAGPSNSSIVFLSRMCSGRIYKWLQPHPEVNKNICVGCGECARSCPQKTIEMRRAGKKRKRAFILSENCIKCYCCQELCPYKAVRIRKNLIMKLLGG